MNSLRTRRNLIKFLSLIKDMRKFQLDQLDLSLKQLNFKSDVLTKVSRPSIRDTGEILVRSN